MRSEKRKWLVLLAMCFAFFLAAIDTTVMNLAVVWIQKDFNAPLPTVQWVLSGYFLSFASFIIAAGKFSDHFGHRRMFSIGVIVFLIFSICGALSQSIWQLIISRVLQGFGGALFWPSVNALTMNSFDEKSRGTAMGILTGVAGFAMSVGPPFGGFLIRALSWRLILWFNVPLCILAIITMFAFVPKDEKYEKGKIDFLAMVLIVVGLFSLFFALNRGNVVGFDDKGIIITIVLSILVLIGFLINEFLSKRPLVDFELLKNSCFTTSVLLRTLGSGASFFTILFLLAFYLQHIIGYSPVMAGLYYLPMTIMLGIIPAIFGKIQKKVGSYFPMYFGSILGITAFIYFLFLNWTELTFAKIFFPLFLFGLAMGLVWPSNIIIALKDVPKNLRGLGVGLLYTCVLLSGTSLVIFSAIAVKNIGTAKAREALKMEQIVLTPSQDVDLEKAVTGLKDAGRYSKEFSSSERGAVLQAVRYGFEQAFFFILKICIALYSLVLIIFALAHVHRLKKSS